MCYNKNMNAEIIPAIMPRDFDDIVSHVSLVRMYVDTVQIDLMDGKYVPESTWPFFRDSNNYLEKLKNQDKALPFWEDVNYELDLMITRPEEDLETWLGIGAARVIFHYSSVLNWQKIRDIDRDIRNFIEIGLALKVDDNIEDAYFLIDEGMFDFIQVMGIAHIGYQGESFDERSINLIKVLKKRYPNIVISVDGGVSRETISSLLVYGSSRFVSGSFVFGDGIVKENIQDLKDQLVTTLSKHK